MTGCRMALSVADPERSRRVSSLLNSTWRPPNSRSEERDLRIVLCSRWRADHVNPDPPRRIRATKPDVQAKARAAVEWYKNATDHELKFGGKPWTYLLIPHDVITESKTLQGLAATYAIPAGSATIGTGEARARNAPIPFARVTPRADEKYRTCVPLLTLKAAAGAFGDPQHRREGQKQRQLHYYPTDKLLQLIGLSTLADLPQVEEWQA